MDTDITMINKKYYVLTTQMALNSLDRRIVGKVTDVEDLCLLLENTLFQVLNPKDFNLNDIEFAVERLYQKNIQPNHIEISGEYVSLDVWKKKSQIDEALTLFVSSKEKLIYFDDDKWEKLKYSVLQTFVHELVHVDQSRKRHGDCFDVKTTNGKRTEQDYLGETDEIDAYAFNGAIDLIALQQTLNDVDMDVDWRKLMRTGAVKKLSIEFASYYGAFENTDRKVLNKYLKRVWKYVHYLENTKVKGLKYDIYQQAS